MHRYVMLLVATLLAAGSASAQFLPLQEGFGWEYIEPGGGNWTVVNGGQTSFGGEQCTVQFHVQTGFGDQEFRQFWSQDTGGDTYYHGGLNPSNVIVYDPPVLYFDAPFEVGKTWSTLSADGLTTRLHTFTVQDQQQVVVPAGAFTAWHLIYNVDGFDLDLYVVDGIGEVTHGIFELVSYGQGVATRARSFSDIKALFRN